MSVFDTIKESLGNSVDSWRRREISRRDATIVIAAVVLLGTGAFFLFGSSKAKPTAAHVAEENQRINDHFLDGLKASAAQAKQVNDEKKKTR